MHGQTGACATQRQIVPAIVRDAAAGCGFTSPMHLLAEGRVERFW